MTREKRIIITGASGVGKTTLVEALAPLLSLQVIPELGRVMCNDLGFKTIGEIPNQEQFKQDVLKAQIVEEDRLKSFISDRSTIDCWVLWQRWNLCSAMTYDTEAYYRSALAQALKYSHIIYVPPMFPPIEDGFRWTDADYQSQIDRMVRTTLYDWGLWERTYTVGQTPVEDRIEEIKRLF